MLICKFKVLNVGYTCYICTQQYRYRQLTVYKLNYRVQFLSPLMKVKPKMIETETTLALFPYKTTGGPIGSQNDLKLNACNFQKTITEYSHSKEGYIFFLILIFC